VLAHLCLVPLGDSAPEIWTVQDLLGTVAEARQRKPDLDARLVWTRYRAQTREARDLSEAVQHELEHRTA
jgi:chromosome partitioning protein